MANITVQQFQPSEIIAIFNEILAHQNNQASGKLVCIRGLYLKGNGIAYNGVWTAEISGWSEHFLTYIAAFEGIENTFADLN